MDKHSNVCQDCGNGGDLLLCDTCPRVHHRKCLTPPLRSVPDDDWFCPHCVAVGKDKQALSPVAHEHDSSSSVNVSRQNIPFIFNKIYSMCNLLVSSGLRILQYPYNCSTVLDKDRIVLSYVKREHFQCSSRPRKVPLTRSDRRRRR